MLDAGALSRALASRALQLCQTILPNGVKEGPEWKIGGVDGQRGRSMGVHLYGGKAGIWADFSTGETGDALDLVKAVQCGGEILEAMDWARAWLGTAYTAPAPAPAQQSERRSQPDELKRRNAAKAIFLTAAPRLAGTPADVYLRGRGIDLEQLGRQPRALRFHPGLWNGESRQHWPAMVAAVCDGAAELVGVHRTWLARDATGQWQKAPLQAPKASLGRISGGTIRLWRGASGKPLADAPDGETACIGEGIETCLSVALACPEMRVLCGVSLGNLGRIELPPAITTIIIAADNDAPGGPAEAALHAALRRLVSTGRQVRIARSPVGSDFNDCLTG